MLWNEYIVTAVLKWQAIQNSPLRIVTIFIHNLCQKIVTFSSKEPSITSSKKLGNLDLVIRKLWFFKWTIGPWNTDEAGFRGCTLFCRFKNSFPNFSIHDSNSNRTYISLVGRIGMKILSTYTTVVSSMYSTLLYVRVLFIFLSLAAF